MRISYLHSVHLCVDAVAELIDTQRDAIMAANDRDMEAAAAAYIFLHV